MREGWTYKKLGEVCSINSGKSIKSNLISTDIFEGGFPCYGGNGLRGYVPCNSHEGGLPVIGRVGALCGNVHYVQQPFYATEHALVVSKISEDVDHVWLCRLLESMKLGDYAEGVAQPVIAASKIAKLCISIPPLTTQQQIVSELDLLSHILDQKRQQLKEYDALAESIFYDMFGDPVENPKGWPTKKVIEVVTLQRGHDLPIGERDINGLVPVYGSNGILGVHSASKIDKGIITGRSGTIGNIFISDKPFWPLNTTLYSKDTHGNDLIFLKYLLEKFNLKRFSEGAGVPTLNRNNFHNEMIIDIPLTLQRSFAAKIRSIEHQKQLLRASIKETEMLFQSRMDYWFNS